MVPEASRVVESADSRHARASRCAGPIARCRATSRSVLARLALVTGAGMRRRWTACVGVGLASALTAGLMVPLAAADTLRQQRAQVARQIAQSRSDLTESSRSLARATVTVQHTQQRLQAARAALARTRRELAEARRVDRLMAAKLARAKAELAAAKAAVLRGQRALDAQKAEAGAIVRDQYQKQTNLLPLAILVGESTADLATRLQWATTMFDTTQAQIDRLTELQVRLTAERARMARAEAAVAADRREAAAALRTTRALEQQARRHAGEVAALLQRRTAEMRAAAKELAADRARHRALHRERVTVERRIALRIAKARAAARRAAARAAAARRAAAAAQREADRARRGGGATSSGRSGRSGSGGGGGYGTPAGMRPAAHGFSYPVNGPITSAYGRRFHPVLHIWKLHDGTDFGSGCGTPIRAAYRGRVAERYYNAGYGNRLLIDHGYVDGRYVTTGYNHAIRYIVGVGQRVREGQVIGYVGSTGYSTGCHLHLMVWLNGRMANPMSWF